MPKANNEPINPDQKAAIKRSTVFLYREGINIIYRDATDLDTPGFSQDASRPTLPVRIDNRWNRFGSRLIAL